MTREGSDQFLWAPPVKGHVSQQPSSIIRCSQGTTINMAKETDLKTFLLREANSHLGSATTI